MERIQYQALERGKLDSESGFRRPGVLATGPVKIDSPAFDVMTDLRRVVAVTVAPEVGLEDARRLMILRGVRLLLVIDVLERIEGVVTAHDLLGERPLRVMSERNLAREDLSVRDVMTRAPHLDVLSMDDLLRSKVGHVVETLRQTGRQHLLVSERDETGRQWIVGIISASQIARQMGIALPPVEVAQTFAEIEAAIAR
jgi:CBS domain-containing protein